MDLQLESGEYFLNEQQRKLKKKQEKMAKCVPAYMPACDLGRVLVYIYVCVWVGHWFILDGLDHLTFQPPPIRPNYSFTGRRSARARRRRSGCRT